MIRVVPGSDEAVLAACRDIRERVFCQEQGVNPDLEWDGLDPQCQHLLALKAGAPCGTARIRVLTSSSIGKIERVAVIRSMRRLGIGHDLMRRACAQLVMMGCSTAVLNAQVSVKDFYRDLGFVADGPVFEEANIPHIKMRKILES